MNVVASVRNQISWRVFDSHLGFRIHLPKSWQKFEGPKYYTTGYFKFAPNTEPEAPVLQIYVTRLSQEVTLEQDFLQWRQEVRNMPEVTDLSIEVDATLGDLKANRVHHKIIRSSGRVLHCIVVWTIHYKTRYQLTFHWNNNVFDQFGPLANAIIQSFCFVRIPRKMMLTTFISKDHTFAVKVPSSWEEVPVASSESATPVAHFMLKCPSDTTKGRMWMTLKLLVTVENVKKPTETNLDEYADLLLLQSEKMLPNKSVQLQIKKCRLGNEPARCVQFASDAIQIGEIYIQLFTVRNNKRYVMTFMASNVFPEERQLSFQVFERIAASFRFFREADVHKEAHDAQTTATYEDLVAKCGIQWSRDDYILIDDFPPLYIFHLVQKPCPQSSQQQQQQQQQPQQQPQQQQQQQQQQQEMSKKENLSTPLAVEESSYLCVNVMKTTAKTLSELVASMKQTYTSQYQQRQLVVSYELEENTLVGGLDGYLLLVTVKNPTLNVMTSKNNPRQEQYPEEKILHKFALKDGVCVSIFFNALAEQWDAQWKVANKYIDTFYFFK